MSINLHKPEQPQLQLAVNYFHIIPTSKGVSNPTDENESNEPIREEPKIDNHTPF